jgi:hypothetical protein
MSITVGAERVRSWLDVEIGRRDRRAIEKAAVGEGRWRVGLPDVDGTVRE